MEEARRQYGLPASLPESATLSAALAETFAGGNVPGLSVNGFTNGAVINDGVGLATAAIRNACAAAAANGGGPVDLGRGTFLVDGSFGTQALTIPSNVWLRGESKMTTIIKLAASQANGLQIIGSAVGAVRPRVSSLTIDGNRDNQSQGQFGVWFNAATFGAIYDVRVINTKSHAITVDHNSTDCLVGFNEIGPWGFSLGEGFGIVVFWGGLRNKVVFNYVTNTGSGSYGIAADASSAAGGGTASDGNTFAFNTVDGCAYGIISEDSHGSRIFGNILRAQTAIAVYVAVGQDVRTPLRTLIQSNVIQDFAASGSAAVLVLGSQTTVSENHLYNTGPNLGIKFGQPPVALRPNRDNRAVDNVIDGIAGDAIFAEDGESLLIEGNKIRGQTAGIPINIVPADAMKVVRILRNDISTKTNGVAFAAPGINVSGPSTINHLDIDDNVIQNDGMTNAQDGIVVAVVGAISRVGVHRNRVIDTQGSPLMRNGLSISGTIGGFIEVTGMMPEGLTGVPISDAGGNQLGQTQPLVDRRVVTAWTASWTIDASTGNDQELAGSTATTGYTINAPTNPQIGQVLDVSVKNTSGGALGAATWNAVFKMTAWTNPANGFSRSIRFRYNGTNWVERGRAAADVPN